MNRLLFLLALSVALPTVASAQKLEMSRVFFDAVPFSGDSDAAVRLDLIAAVPHGVLAFDRIDGRFTAGYRVRLAVQRNATDVFDTSFERTVSVTSPDLAGPGSPHYDFFQVPVNLPAGTYEAAIELVEQRSGHTGARKRAVSLVDYAAYPFGLSGLLLVSRIREDSTGHVITPMLTDNVSVQDDGYFVFFEAYNRGDSREVVLSARHRHADGTSSSPALSRRPISTGRSQQWLRLQTDGLSRGTYVVEIRALDASDTSRVLAVTERSVSVEGTEAGLPIGEAELDERVSQLMYVATQTEIDQIRAEREVRARQQAFAAFWRDRDPSPGTPENEAMRQYYARVDYANEHFRSYAAGWLTDQGRIYIIYGPPDNVSRQPFRSDGRAIEVWQYYSRGLELRFQDDSGFGDYRLTTPVSSLEKYRYQG